MIGKTRPRWLMKSAVTASLALLLAACGQDYPNTTFVPLSETAVEIDKLWDLLLYLGVAVFVLVEAVLIYIVIRYRHKDGTPEPKHVHGHVQLEIAWTLVPAVILAVIAVPTVRAIFVTQGDPPANALVVEVRAHQWWWEFDYPEFGFKTANELYIPTGRTVVFNISTENVLHSFWPPRLAGKRDAVNRRVNKIWFTAHDSAAGQVFNGFCAEFCGDSHGNMQFRVFVLDAANFERWSAHQKTPALLLAPSQPPAGVVPAGGAAPAAAPSAAAAAAAAQNVYEFPRDRIPDYAVPKTPYPDSVTVDENLVGDAARGAQTFIAGGCVSCHAVVGTGFQNALAPNLTHVATRTTIGGAIYPNTRSHLLRWVKNAPGMKPGAKMPAQGKGIMNQSTGVAGMLDDQQIADIVAYLMSLK